VLDLDVIEVLQQSNLCSGNILECMPGAFSIATDVTCHKIIHNPVAAGFFRIKDWGNFSHVQSPSVKVLKHGRLLLTEELPMEQSALYGYEITGSELEFVWEDGVSKTAIWNTSPLRDETGVIIGAIANFEEVTELIGNNRTLHSQRQALQELVEQRTKALKQESDESLQLKRAVAKLEQMNVIGQMAAGLAHEVRNPMSTIRGFLQLLQNKIDLLTYKNYFDLMIEELDRTNSIIQEFLSLTKNKAVDMKRQNLNEVLVHLFPLIQADAMNQGKQFIFKQGDIDEIDFDQNGMTQLILNFARNGLEAMQKYGCLTIATYMERENIVLSVQDEGPGIKPEDILKLGTPFFTTKENGTGLGIPTCYSIAEKHGAQIKVETGSGGTSFLVRFPKPK